MTAWMHYNPRGFKELEGWMSEPKGSDIFDSLSGELRDPEFYSALGFRSGLEIHQQLLTEKKLFCHCPAGRYVDTHDAVILRHMRPTLSELGEYDGTALMEFKTRKEIVYLLNRENVCTYEMDDSPPFMMNLDALNIAIELAQLLRCQIVNEIHIIRKQYLDGSIPTGFQRTAIVGVDGSIPFRGRRIQIVQLAIEEDSCREVSDKGHRITFRTDRLNMPLSEMVTAPEMRNPEEVAAVCDILGRVARVTGKVRRGLGAARQDVNVSITGGCRVEIKGVCRIAAIPKLVHNEALRQARLLAIRDHLLELGLTADAINGGSHDVTAYFTGTKTPLLRTAIENGAVIRLQVLPRARSVLRAFIQPGLRFAQELSGRVRVIACLDDPVNIFIRDERHGIGLARQNRPDLSDPAYLGPSEREWRGLVERSGAADDDGLVLVWGPARDTATAIEEIRARMAEALRGIPSETRMPFPSGTTDFERILPGPDRMYPDTDLPPMPLQDSELDAIAGRLPELPWERGERLQAAGLPRRMARELALSPRYGLLKELLDLTSSAKQSRLLGWIFHDLLKALGRKGFEVERLAYADLKQLLTLFLEQRLFREAIQIILERLVSRDADAGSPALPQLLERHLPEVARGETPVAVDQEELGSLFGELGALPFAGESKRIRALMGRAMSRYRGIVAGEELFEAVCTWCRRNPPGNEGGDG
jgi:glutamyl-tRNA(Gln) amidotransferase subunit E